MFKQLIFFLMTSFAVPLFAHGGAVCFNNQAEYVAVKSSLPAAFQSLPVAFSGLPDVKAALKADFIRAGKNKGKLLLRYTYDVAGFTQEDTSMSAGKICVDGSKVTMGDYKGQISGNVLTVTKAFKTMKLVKTNASGYDKVAQIVAGQK